MHLQSGPSSEFQLSVILSLKGVITFMITYMMYQKFSFLFDIYEMVRYTLKQNWEILKTSTSKVVNLQPKL